MKHLNLKLTKSNWLTTIKLTVLTILLLTTSTSFSQTATDTSFVILPEVVAREVARDLIQKDRLQEESKLLYRQIEVKDMLLINNIQITSRLERRIDTLEEIILNREKQIEEYKSLTQVLQSDLRRNRIQKHIYRTTTAVVLVGAGAFYLNYIYYVQ